MVNIEELKISVNTLVKNNRKVIMVNLLNSILPLGDNLEYFPQNSTNDVHTYSLLFANAGTREQFLHEKSDRDLGSGLHNVAKQRQL